MGIKDGKYPLGDLGINTRVSWEFPVRDNGKGKQCFLKKVIL